MRRKQKKYTSNILMCDSFGTTQPWTQPDCETPFKNSQNYSVQGIKAHTHDIML